MSCSSVYRTVAVILEYSQRVPFGLDRKIGLGFHAILTAQMRGCELAPQHSVPASNTLPGGKAPGDNSRKPRQRLRSLLLFHDGNCRSCGVRHV